MHVAMNKPPPPLVAYAEDNRDRLWTGKGAGIWRCLTNADAKPYMAPRPWSEVWQEHGPMVPLVPAGELAVAAIALEFRDRLPALPGLPLNVADLDEPARLQWARRALALAVRSPALAGLEVPWAPGYVWGHCGHTLAAAEYRAGFRTCERCGHRVER